MLQKVEELFEAWYESINEEEIETGVCTAPDKNRIYKAFEAGFKVGFIKAGGAWDSILTADEKNRYMNILLTYLAKKHGGEEIE